jgi:hypothetical protein
VQNVHTPVILNILFSSRQIFWRRAASSLCRPGPAAAGGRRKSAPANCCPGQLLPGEHKSNYSWSRNGFSVCPGNKPAYAPYWRWLSCLSVRNGDVARRLVPVGGGRPGQARLNHTRKSITLRSRRSRSSEVTRPKSLVRSHLPGVACPESLARSRSRGGGCDDARGTRVVRRENGRKPGWFRTGQGVEISCGELECRNSMTSKQIC